MKLYDKSLTCMDDSEALKSFENVFTMVDGWVVGQHEPLPGEVYWIHPLYLVSPVFIFR